jgi:hypothetical protein
VGAQAEPSQLAPTRLFRVGVGQLASQARQRSPQRRGTRESALCLRMRLDGVEGGLPQPIGVGDHPCEQDRAEVPRRIREHALNHRGGDAFQRLADAHVEGA